MHEQSLVRAVVNRVVALARDNRAERVRKVTVHVGVLGHGDAEQLQALFDRQALGTLAEGATLVVVPTDELIDLALTEVDLELPGPQ